MEHYFGGKRFRIVRQEGGATNLVFTVHHAQGDFIVRPSPDPAKIGAFMKEQWATAKAREAGVPATEVVEVGNEVIPMPYMIARKSKGREATFHPERIKIVREMGSYAAKLDSDLGFGTTFEWSQNQLSHNATWSVFLRNELMLQDRLHTLEIG
jgi:hygromycin-B 4-O-kinase